MVKENLNTTTQNGCWNITDIIEGRIFEHIQTGKIAFVPKQTDVGMMAKAIKIAVKSIIKEMKP